MNYSLSVLRARATYLLFACMAAAFLWGTLSTPAVSKPREINVAYFLEWPTPNQVAQLEDIYDKELGVKVNWKAFGNGNDMSAAMASGDVQISYSQGLIPFIVAVSKGLPITTIGIAVSYAEADNCVVHQNAGLDRSSAASVKRTLRGMKIATPVGNVTHYKLLKTLNYYGLDADDVNIVPVSGGNDAAAAFLSGRVDIGCAFGGPLEKMGAKGKVLMTGAEQENIGILTFDVISVHNRFMKQYPELVTKFMQVTEDANRAYADRPDENLGVIARAAGMKPKATKKLLSQFYFPSRREQLSDAWMGGNVQKLTQGAAEFFVEQGVMRKSLNSYNRSFKTKFLRQIK